MPTFVPDLLKGQAAVITGGGSGLGLAIADAFASHGASVLIASRSGDRLDAARTQLARHGNPVEVFVVDVRKSADVDRMIDRAWEAFGRLDHLVNNAAGNFFSPASQMSDNAFGAVLNIDLFGTFYCSRAAAQRWQDKDHPGRILNISMTLHYRGFPGMVHASSAKAGIDAMTHTLAVEWAPLIHVNAIAPGPVPTEGVKKAFEIGGAFALPERAIPLGRFGTPDDVANAALFLSSPGADWITGSILVVDGGEWLSRPMPHG